MNVAVSSLLRRQNISSSDSLSKKKKMRYNSVVVTEKLFSYHFTLRFLPCFPPTISFKQKHRRANHRLQPAVRKTLSIRKETKNATPEGVAGWQWQKGGGWGIKRENLSNNNLSVKTRVAMKVRLRRIPPLSGRFSWKLLLSLLHRVWLRNGSGSAAFRTRFRCCLSPCPVVVRV